MARLARPLTSGERALLQSVFADRIPYGAVRIHNHKAYFFQPGSVAMAPDGHIYFPGRHYIEDFAGGNVHQRAWFVHEGAHLFQHYALGWNLKVRGLWDRRYRYRLEPGRPFDRYGLEQQGDIAAHYYLAREGHDQHLPYRLEEFLTILPLI